MLHYRIIAFWIFIQINIYDNKVCYAFDRLSLSLSLNRKQNQMEYFRSKYRGSIALVLKVGFVIELSSYMAVKLCEKRTRERVREKLRIEEMSKSRNCYLFCLVCFSICMNISQTVHFQFMILLSPISKLKGRVWERERERNGTHEMKEWTLNMCKHPSGMKTTYHFFLAASAVAIVVVVVVVIVVFHLCSKATPLYC